MSVQTIAIVGGGFAGTALVHALERTGSTARLLWFERSRSWGRGLAYAQADNVFRLNARSSRMFLDADCATAFAQSNCCTREDFAPRSDFGAWLEMEAEAAWLRIEGRSSESPSFPSRRIEADVVSVEGSAIRTRSEVFAFDRLVLAVGSGEVRIPHAVQPFLKSDRLIANPYDLNRLRSIPCDDQIVLIGSGLTSIDVFLFLQARGHRGGITMLSRHGQWPMVHSDIAGPTIPSIDVATLSSSPRELLSWVRAQCKLQQARGEPWQYIFDALRKSAPSLWQGASEREQTQFLRHLRVYWETRRHRIPKETADLLQEAEAQGSLRRMRGRLSSVYETSEGLRLMTKQGAVQQELNAQRVILCSGPETDLHCASTPLLKSLLSQSRIRADIHRLGIDVDQYDRAVSSEADAMEIYVLGAMARSRYFENTAAPEIAAQAHRLAMHLTQQERR